MPLRGVFDAPTKGIRAHRRRRSGNRGPRGPPEKTEFLTPPPSKIWQGCTALTGLAGLGGGLSWAAGLYKVVPLSNGMHVGIIFCCYLQHLMSQLRKRCGSEGGRYHHLLLFTPKMKNPLEGRTDERIHHL